jgi:hypothetical protein
MGMKYEDDGAKIAELERGQRLQIKLPIKLLPLSPFNCCAPTSLLQMTYRDPHSSM